MVQSSRVNVWAPRRPKNGRSATGRGVNGAGEEEVSYFCQFFGSFSALSEIKAADDRQECYRRVARDRTDSGRPLLAPS